MKENVSPLMEVVGERLGESASCGGCLAEAGGMRVWLSTQAWWPAPPRSALPMGLAGGGFPDGNRINCILQTFTHGNCHFWILKTRMGGAWPFTFKSGCFCRTWYMVGVGGGSPGQGYPPFQILGCDWSEIITGRGTMVCKGLEVHLSGVFGKPRASLLSSLLSTGNRFGVVGRLSS